eukprot:gnl/TRDRNA2_/TRDRNA2_135561_c1_seq2.p1 gnl/TRDRNA2_/TRDRNA2_135561_c1~~gnl/TRDRNA2_/TRDRNA2_135561_c1_seq2.p1  ORF type:complete len:142 (+),score=15.55 gnl/TRDRNA2_/TRDRNA2_135561_c1_seq2:370-795(+)
MLPGKPAEIKVTISSPDGATTVAREVALERKTKDANNDPFMEGTYYCHCEEGMGSGGDATRFQLYFDYKNKCFLTSDGGRTICLRSLKSDGPVTLKKDVSGEPAKQVTLTWEAPSGERTDSSERHPDRDRNPAARSAPSRD